MKPGPQAWLEKHTVSFSVEVNEPGAQGRHTRSAPGRPTCEMNWPSGQLFHGEQLPAFFVALKVPAAHGAQRRSSVLLPGASTNWPSLQVFQGVQPLAALKEPSAHDEPASAETPPSGPGFAPPHATNDTATAISKYFTIPPWDESRHLIATLHISNRSSSRTQPQRCHKPAHVLQDTNCRSRSRSASSEKRGPMKGPRSRRRAVSAKTAQPIEFRSVVFAMCHCVCQSSPSFPGRRSVCSSTWSSWPSHSTCTV